MACHYNVGYPGYVTGVNYIRPPTQVEYWNNTYWNNTYSIQTGSYEHVSTKQSYYTGFYKNQYNASSTYRVGDQRGYTEYYKQEQVTRVDYGTASGCIGYGGGNGYMPFGYHGPTYGNNYYYY